MMTLTDLNAEWRLQASCRDSAGWFDIPNIGLKAQRIACAAQIAVCRDCPVRVPCLEWAMEHNEPGGLWGGLLPKERRNLRREAGGGGTSSRCGTLAGYAWHRRREELPCEDCKRANRTYTEKKRRERL